MHRIVAGGTGFVGQAVVENWVDQGCDVTVIGRSEEKIKSIFNNKVTALSWDAFKQDPKTILKACDCILNLTGAGVGDKPWSEARKQEILSSRIESTELIANAIAQLGDTAPRYLNASAIGIYGAQEELEANLPEPFDENSPIDAPKDFLSEVGVAWEQASAVAPRVVNLRFGVVLDKSGGALVKMALPFRLFVGGRVGSGHQPLSWISLSDLISVIDFVLEKPDLVGPINCVAMQAVKQIEFAHSLARALKRPCWLPMPGFVLKLIYGEMAEALLLKGQHVVPTRLAQAGFHFKYPHLDDALAAIYDAG